mmetsp:Transcript_20192/g.51227  ORF Transcript_20192/g.51227 Transcript_20192/m.51227 type:complete len:157 (+) Transcript_20192:320-790(+)
MPALCLPRGGWAEWLADRVPGLPELYNVGPLGQPQPFRTVHGEWGPPVGKISDIDWELYSVALICCDTLLTVVWHIFAAGALRDVRVHWLSPTFRVSLGYMFGTTRLSLVSAPRSRAASRSRSPLPRRDPVAQRRRGKRASARSHASLLAQPLTLD